MRSHFPAISPVFYALQPILYCPAHPSPSQPIQRSHSARAPQIDRAKSHAHLIPSWYQFTNDARRAPPNRFLSDSIRRHVLDPALVPTALRNLRGALFPNNAMGTPTLFPPESDDELLALRRRCASALWALVPRAAGRLFFGGSAASWLARWLKADASSPSPSLLRSGPATNAKSTNSTSATTSEATDTAAGEARQRAQVEGSGGGTGVEQQQAPDARIISDIETGVLDVFSDPYCNKHLMYGALELVLVRLVPELAEKGVVELWEERLS